MVLGYISWEVLREQVEIEALVQVQIEPHINKPPRTSQVADRLAEQEFLDYLMKKVINSAEQITAERKLTTASQSFCCR
jgi:hypothetical protein